LCRIPLRLVKAGIWTVAADYNGVPLVAEQTSTLQVLPAAIISPERSSLQGMEYVWQA
jgi:hypothetical protein